MAIVGSGIAGLSASRALKQAGIDDFRIFELDSAAGGNSRQGELAGFQCPWGAHYLPTPDLKSKTPAEVELIAMLREFGLIEKTLQGEQFAERALCHAPQERVLVDGIWQTGLLPLDGVSPATLAQYRRFSALIKAQQEGKQFAWPASLPSSAIPDAMAALDRVSFVQWLDEHKLDDSRLRWYLDYCCRDDYGADSNEVSAWAGIHYFASRHGFSVPGESSGTTASSADAATELLTWPQGNGWLVQRMCASLGDQLQLNSLVRSVQYQPSQTARLRSDSSPDRSGAVKLDVWLPLENRAELWSADFVVLAIPLNVAARILQPIPASLSSLLPKLRYSAWQVANLHLRQLPPELPGAPLSWDNVIYGRDWLGFVDAGHQLLQSHRRQTVWTSYRALGSSMAARRDLLGQSWREQSMQVLAELKGAYPDIERYVESINLVRWGHAMLLPSPGLRSLPAFQNIREFDARVHIAHSDLAGYSIFEEAFAAGFLLGRKIAGQIKT